MPEELAVPPEGEAGGAVPPRPAGDAIISHFMAQTGFMSSGSIVDKANTEQLDKLIAQADEGAKREDAYKTQVLYAICGILVSAMILISGLCWMFLYFHEVNSLQQIVTLLVGLSSGGVGGFGVARWTGPKPSA